MDTVTLTRIKSLPMTDNPVLWAPGVERQQATHMYRFMSEQSFDSFDELYRWSISDSPAFWQALCTYCQVHFTKAAKTTLARADNIMDAGWFEGSTLNFAEHLL